MADSDGSLSPEAEAVRRGFEEGKKSGSSINRPGGYTPGHPFSGNVPNTPHPLNLGDKK